MLKSNFFVNTFTDTALFGAGYNDDGMFGDDIAICTTYSTPIQIAKKFEVQNIKQIDTGSYHAILLTS